MSFTKKKRGNKYKYSKKRRNNKITKKNKKIRGGVGKRKQDVLTAIQSQITDTLTELPNRQNRCIKRQDAQFCVNGPDFQINENYRALLNYFQNDSEMAEINKTKILFLIDGMTLRAGLIRNEDGQYQFPDLMTLNQIDDVFPFGQLLKFVVVQDKSGIYKFVYGNARMPNVNYAEEFFLKWTDMTQGDVWSIRDSPKTVVYITNEIIRDIEKFVCELDRNMGLRLEWDQLLATKSLNPSMYESIMRVYFNGQNGQHNYSDPDKVFMLPSYEVSHSALPNGRPNTAKSNEPIRRPLIYAGCEGVFWRNETGEICFVIANRSGHYQTPKGKLLEIKEIMEQLGYKNIVLITEQANKMDISSQSDSESDSDSDSEDESEYIWYISNCLNNYKSARDKLKSADTTSDVNNNYTKKSISYLQSIAKTELPPPPPSIAKRSTRYNQTTKQKNK